MFWIELRTNYPILATFISSSCYYLAFHARHLWGLGQIFGFSRFSDPPFKDRWQFLVPHLFLAVHSRSVISATMAGSPVSLPLLLESPLTGVPGLFHLGLMNTWTQIWKAMGCALLLAFSWGLTCLYVATSSLKSRELHKCIFKNTF